MRLITKQTTLFGFVLLCCGSASQEQIEASPVGSMRIHTFNTEVDISAGDGWWNLEAPMGVAFFQQLPSGIGAAYCLGSCSLHGRIPVETKLQLILNDSSADVSDLNQIQAQITNGRIFMDGVHHSTVHAGKGTIEALVPEGGYLQGHMASGDAVVQLEEGVWSLYADAPDVFSSIENPGQGGGQIFLSTADGRLWVSEGGMLALGLLD
jgi:hypothetical protein